MSMRSIYRKIARKNGISVKEVRDEMQKVIDATWGNPDKTVENTFVQNQVKPNGDKPTTEELIRYCADQVNKRK